jgi:hypothetical protein
MGDSNARPLVPEINHSSRNFKNKFLNSEIILDKFFGIRWDTAGIKDKGSAHLS